MLELLFTIACENVIVAETGVTSLINILEKVDSEMPAEAPEKVMVPMKWSVISLWTRGATDVPEPIQYEQRTIVINPEGDQIFDITVPFVVSNEHANYRNLGQLNGFPISQNGTLTVEVHLRKKGDEKWEKRFTLPIVTERKIVEKKENDDKTQIQLKNDPVTSLS